MKYSQSERNAIDALDAMENRGGGSGRIVTHWGFVLLPRHMEGPFGESLTVPDETMSIQELMNRFINGQRVPDNLFRPGGFDDGSDFDSDDLEKLRDVDLVERDDAIQRLKEFQAAKQAELDAEKKRQDVISLKEKKRQGYLSALISPKKKKRKVAAGPARDQGAKRPSKGADEGSE